MNNAKDAYDLANERFAKVLAEYRLALGIKDKPKLPDTNAADMAKCVNRLRAHLEKGT